VDIRGIKMFKTSEHAILEEYARETVLEAFEPDDSDLRQYPIRVDADEDSVESWFTYRVMGG
jgi:hypothetical protein